MGIEFPHPISDVNFYMAFVSRPGNRRIAAYISTILFTLGFVLTSKKQLLINSVLKGSLCFSYVRHQSGFFQVLESFV